MSSPPTRRTVTDALIAMLATATGRPIGDADVPTPPGSLSPGMPYAIVYPIAGGGYQGPWLTGPELIADFAYQVTCVGVTRVQAEDLTDRVRQAVIGRAASGAFSVALAVTGMTVMCREADGGAGGVDRVESKVGTSIEALYQTAERYVVTVTAA